MVYFIIFVIVLIFVFSKSRKKEQQVKDRKARFQPELTVYERKLAQELSIEKAILTKILEYTRVQFKPLFTKNEVREKQTQRGITTGFEGQGVSFDVDAKFAELLVSQLSKRFYNQGYLLFMIEQAPFKMAVVKTNNQWEVLSTQGTNGTNYNLTTKAIRTKLEAWDAEYSLLLVGCGADWVMLHFSELPKDITALTKEIYDFCPDVVNQHGGILAALEADIAITKSVYLRWK